MLVSEFLALVPGPKALVGAVISCELPERGKPAQVVRITGEESVGHLVTVLSNWHIVERPPLYQDPSARYCGWCRSQLYTGYRPSEGLVAGWCSDHGPHAKVLHDPDVQDKRYIDALLKVKSLEPKLQEKLVDVAPGSVPDVLRKNADAPKATQVTEQQAALIKKLGFDSLDEFKRLAGVKS